MKKKGIIITVIAVILIALSVSGYMFITWNSRILDGMVKNMKAEIERCKNIELIETQSVYGKLNGNGNGIDFFGAALIRSDSELYVTELVDSLEGIFNIVEYNPQHTKPLETPFLQHRKVSFDHNFDGSDTDTYYAVYFIASHKDANLLDPAGH